MGSINMPTMGYYRGTEEKMSAVDRCVSVLMIPERKKLQKNVYLKEIIINNNICPQCAGFYSPICSMMS